MALVEYSGSESSDEEEKPSGEPSEKAKAPTNKSAFQKVVDSSNPRKIQVNLPVAPTVDDQDSERPAKRSEIGGGGLSGFNALLPAPKRAAASSNGGASTNSARKTGLGSGVSLRTGAAPGFSRDGQQEGEYSDHEEASAGDLHVKDQGPVQLPTENSAPNKADLSPQKSTDMTKPKGKTTMFKPLSVARKPQKKKPALHNGLNGTKAENIESLQKSRPVQKKVSLFSIGDTAEIDNDSAASKGAYQPMVYQDDVADAVSTNPMEIQETESDVNDPIGSDPGSQLPQSLDSIASDLNLSKSAKRQLFGRQKNNSSAINIVNFNTDEEYKANEAARHSGEQVQHNPVRAIAPGKHSLKQLVNMGTMQADALEESFASGRRNRSEAGSKYGW